jgi:hypothetical protein
MNIRAFTLTLAFAASTVAMIPSAEAGGICGRNGSLIRGWVGQQCSRATPVVQGAVVVASGVAAGYYLGPQHAPTGFAAGHEINRQFAGQRGPHQQQAAVPMGGVCNNDTIGGFPMGGPAPLGSTCTISLPNGRQVQGTVTP